MGFSRWVQSFGAGLGGRRFLQFGVLRLFWVYTGFGHCTGMGLRIRF